MTAVYYNEKRSLCRRENEYSFLLRLLVGQQHRTLCELVF